MNEVYFEMENAIFRFTYDDAVERLPYFESSIGMTEATTVRNLFTGPDQSIEILKAKYRIGYFALHLIEQGKGGSILQAVR